MKTIFFLIALISSTAAYSQTFKFKCAALMEDDKVISKASTDLTMTITDNNMVFLQEESTKYVYRAEGVKNGWLYVIHPETKQLAFKMTDDKKLIVVGVLTYPP
jgi:hypothetical protein